LSSGIFVLSFLPVHHVVSRAPACRLTLQPAFRIVDCADALTFVRLTKFAAETYYESMFQSQIWSPQDVRRISGALGPGRPKPGPPVSTEVSGKPASKN